MSGNGSSQMQKEALKSKQITGTTSQEAQKTAQVSGLTSDKTAEKSKSGIRRLFKSHKEDTVQIDDGSGAPVYSGDKVSEKHRKSFFDKDADKVSDEATKMEDVQNSMTATQTTEVLKTDTEEDDEVAYKEYMAERERQEEEYLAEEKKEEEEEEEDDETAYREYMTEREEQEEETLEDLTRQEEEAKKALEEHNRRLIAAAQNLDIYKKIHEISNFDKLKKDKRVADFYLKLYNFTEIFEQTWIPDGRIFADNISVEGYVGKITEINAKIMNGIAVIQKSIDEMSEYCAQKRNKEKYAPLGNYLMHLKAHTEDFKDFARVFQEKFIDMIRTNPAEAPKYSRKTLKEFFNDAGMANFFAEGIDTVRREVGHGGINTVYRVHDGISGTSRILKEGKHAIRFLPSRSAKKTPDEIVAENTEHDVCDIIFSRDTKNKAVEFTIDSSYRDVAVSLVDRVLGFSSIVRTSVAMTRDRKQASLMDIADGYDGDHCYVYSGESEKSTAILRSQMRFYAHAVNKMPSSDEMQSLQEERKQFPLLDISGNTAIQSAMNLAALDVIVGHVDRHKGNFFINSEGKIIGIDNDASFRQSSMVLKSCAALEPTEEEKKELIEKEKERVAKIAGKSSVAIDEKEFIERVRKQRTNDAIRNPDSREMQDGHQTNGVNIITDQSAAVFFDGAFPFVTKAFRDKILGISEAVLRNSLAGMVEPKAIDACVERTKQLQDYMNGLPDTLVFDSLDDISDDMRVAYGEYSNSARNFNYLSSLKETKKSSVSFMYGKKTDEQRVQELADHDTRFFKGIVQQYFTIKDFKLENTVAARLGVELLKIIQINNDTDILDMMNSGEMKDLVSAIIDDMKASGIQINLIEK